MFKTRRSMLRSLFPALLGLMLSNPVFAVSDEEMAFLEMYFTDAQLVDTSLRHPMPVSVMAENITVIDAETIERMNAHSVKEILYRVSGIYSSSSGDFGAMSPISMQGSEYRHVRFLLDGMLMNRWDGGEFQDNLIPVEIIQRIEIIKGPASSAWGSSLGGVVNIITRNPAETVAPSGTVQGSYGEANTQDYRGSVTGSAGPVGYYLFAGRQQSDGLRKNRDFDRNSLFSKFTAALTPKVKADLSLGFSDPEVDFGYYPTHDYSATQSYRSWFGNASLSATFTPRLEGVVSLYSVEQESDFTTNTLGLGVYGPERTLLQNNLLEENTLGGRARLIWHNQTVSAVMGMDVDNGEVDKRDRNGTPFQEFGAPETVRADADVFNWAVYSNATINLYDFYLTLGARYDDHDTSGGFFSPSVGLTYDLTQWTILRATLSRGFSAPPLAAIETGGFFLEPNPGLEHEEIWSGQLGVETGELKVVWLKATYFYHDVSNNLEKELYAAGPPAYNDLLFNRGDVLRRGIELEARTRPIHHTSLSAGYSYVHISPANDDGGEDLYTGNISLVYDDLKDWNAVLWGRYTWFDRESDFDGEYDDFIWTLSVNRTVYARKNLKAEIFGVVHNLFNGTQHELLDSENPNRWAEAGVRFKF